MSKANNFVLDFIDQEGKPDRYGEAMQELVRNKPDIILAYGPEASLKGALAATQTIPIVMAAIDYDPITLGYVTSLARPTGNVTGLLLQQIELAEKRIELLREAFPAMKAVTVFWDALSADQWQAAKDSAQRFGLKVTGVEPRDYPYDYEKALALAQAPPGHRRFLIVVTSPFFSRDRERLAQFAIRQRIASISVFRQFAEHGGLMSYGPSRDLFARRAPTMCTGLRVGQSHATCRSSGRPRLNWLSIKKPQRCSTWNFRRRSCCAPTKSSNEMAIAA